MMSVLHHASKILSCALLALIVSACQNQQQSGSDLNNPPKESRTVHSKNRFMSGPYGTEENINTIVRLANATSAPLEVSTRTLDLPNKPLNESVRVYKLAIAPACGDAELYLFEGHKLKILQYEFIDSRGRSQQIRDYLEGPDPFTAPGLWGPYDHTTNSVCQMYMLMGDGEEDGMGLLDSSYAIGWMTSLSESEQWLLGTEYDQAMARLANCLVAQQQPLHKQLIKQYTVQQGDSLQTIARQYYGDAAKWRQIYNHNCDKQGWDNPDAIESGSTIELPGLNQEI